MGHRTLSPTLVFRALFLDYEAFEELRDDDNPFVEGLFLVVLIGFVSAVLSLVGQVLAWAVTPKVAAIKEIVLTALQQQPWWADLTATPEALAGFQQWWDAAWQVFPSLLGAPAPDAAAFNLVAWPFAAMLSWLIYSLLAHGFARLLGGQGTLNQTLGVMALAYTPLLLRGLGFIPFFVIGGVLQTWQLLLRYKAVRTAHGLPWTKALWATLLPYGVYALVWLLLSVVAVLAIALFAAGR